MIRLCTRVGAFEFTVPAMVAALAGTMIVSDARSLRSGPCDASR